MALSNIFKEPRREITETLVGVAVAAGPVALFGWIDHWIALSIQEKDRYIPYGGALVLGGVIIALALLVIFVALIGIHALGETICDALARRGVHLRPRQRPDEEATREEMDKIYDRQRRIREGHVEARIRAYANNSD